MIKVKIIRHVFFMMVSGFNSEKVKNGSDDTEVHKKIREIHFVSCWHENETESEAMWKLYLKSGDGVAIQTTVVR